MSRRTSAVFAAISILLLAVGVASATGPSGVTGDPQVMGAQLADAIKVNADGVKFQTKAPTDVSVLNLTVEPGGTTGWHSHPGLAVIAVSEGTGKLYFADCSSKTFHAGQAFVESGDDEPTLFRNESSSPVLLTVSFIAPRDEEVIHGEADPGCGLS